MAHNRFGRHSSGFGGRNENCDPKPIEEAIKKRPIDVSKLKEDERIRKMAECFARRYSKDKRAKEEELQSLILEQINTEKFFEVSPQERLDWAIILALYLKSFGLKTNQVRKILDLAREIHLEFRGENVNKDRISSKLMRMRFILAYSVGKETSKATKAALEALYKVLDPLLVRVAGSPEKEKFDVVYDFIQAVIAYHRFLGGSEK